MSEPTTETQPVAIKAFPPDIARAILLALRPTADDTVSATAALVFIWLKAFAGDSGRCRYPGRRDLCRFLPFSESTISICERIWVEHGLVAFDPPNARNRDLIILAEPDLTEPELLQCAAMKQSTYHESGSRLIPQTAGPGGREKSRRRKARRDEKRNTPVAVSPGAIDESATSQQPPTIRRRGKPVMTDEIKMLICANARSMNRYLRWGSEAIGLPMDEMEKLPHSPTCFLLEDGESWSQWKPANFAGYYWHRVCAYREKVGMPITMPPVGELCGRVTKILAADGSGWGLTSAQLYEHILKLTHYFDLIRLMVGPGIPLVLNEGTIDHRLCRDKLQILKDMGDDAIYPYWKELQERSTQRREQTEQNDE